MRKKLLIAAIAIAIPISSVGVGSSLVAARPTSPNPAHLVADPPIPPIVDVQAIVDGIKYAVKEIRCDDLHLGCG